MKPHPLELELEDILLPIIDEYNLFNVLDDDGYEKNVNWNKFWQEKKYPGNYSIMISPEKGDGFINVVFHICVLKEKSNIINEVIQRINDFGLEFKRTHIVDTEMAKYTDIIVKFPKDKKILIYESVKFPYPSTNEDIGDVLVFIFDENKIINEEDTDKSFWHSRKNERYLGTYLIDFIPISEWNKYGVVNRLYLNLKIRKKSIGIMREIFNRLDQFGFHGHKKYNIKQKPKGRYDDYYEYELELIRQIYIKDKINDSLVLTFEKWSNKYKKSIDCKNPKGFSQIAHCQARKKRGRGEKTKSEPVK